jgi:hypothetical protein
MMAGATSSGPCGIHRFDRTGRRGAAAISDDGMAAVIDSVSLNAW